MEAVKPIPTAADLEREEKQRAQDLKDYRAKRQKVWYLK